jgi:ribonuclease HI
VFCCLAFKQIGSNSLAALTCWWIWIERNQVIFEGRPPSCQAVVHKILSNFKWQPSSQKILQYKVCDYQLTEGTILICFDGAALSNGLCCGAGGTFRAHQTRTTNWYLNCGAGTNNKAELLGLWVSLTLAKIWNLNHILVLGDSKLIIDWINQTCKFNSVHLEGWKQETLKLSTNFSDIHFSHIPRTHNRAADSLSKRALSGVVGRLSVYHSDLGIESHISSYNLFEG